MNFMENVKETASDLANTVVKKTGEIVDKTKKKYSIYDINNDIKQLYIEIGKLTYLAVIENEEHADSIKLKCDIIKEKLEKIERIKNSMGEECFKCPICGKPADNEEGYCPSCGSNIKNVSDEDFSEDFSEDDGTEE